MFAGAYVVGCILAVLAVRQAGIFTAVIQPPLLLFVSRADGVLRVHRRSAHGYQGHADQLRLSAHRTLPADVLHVGGGAAHRDGPLVHRDVVASGHAQRASRRGARASGGLASAVTSKMSALLAGRTPATRTTRRPTSRAAKHSRAPEPIDKPHPQAREPHHTARGHGTPGPRRRRYIEPVAERPRRPRPPQAEPPPMPPAEPRRRPRSTSGPRRAMPPSTDRRTGYERPERRRRYDDDQPLDCTAATATARITRYRACATAAAKTATTAQSTAPRRRPPRDRAVESWEYDV